MGEPGTNTIKGLEGLGGEQVGIFPECAAGEEADLLQLRKHVGDAVKNGASGQAGVRGPAGLQ